jgi:hypothetical protein
MMKKQEGCSFCYHNNIFCLVPDAFSGKGGNDQAFSTAVRIGWKLYLPGRVDLQDEDPVTGRWK